MRVVIDCDPGNGIPGANVDDGLALALALTAHDAVHLEAVTIVAGNTPHTVGFAAAQKIIGDFGADIPVYLGASRALLEDPGPWRRFLDRGVRDPGIADLWKETPRPPAVRSFPRMPAAQALGELVTQNPGEITVVAIGPLTNLALALRLFPDFAADVSRIVIMGGVFDVDGYLVDTNFGLDPEAAEIVISSGADITLLPMDVTTRTLLTHADVDRFESEGGTGSRRLARGLRPWIGYSAETRGIGGMWIHDVVAVALLVDPSLVRTQSYSVSVDLTPGITRGRSSRWSPGALQRRGGVGAPDPSPVHVVVDVDNARLVRLLADSFRGR